MGSGQNHRAERDIPIVKFKRKRTQLRVKLLGQVGDRTRYGHRVGSWAGPTF